MAERRRAWLALGSNLGDRVATVDGAVRLLDDTPGLSVLARSSLYRTPPWGDPDQGEFVNAAVAVDTTLSPHDLLDRCLGIEARFGRVRGRRWGPRTLDIDLIHVDGVRVADARLSLPHPLWGERAFVLLPLAEIAPDLVIDGRAVRDALARCDAAGIVRMEATER